MRGVTKSGMTVWVVRNDSVLELLAFFVLAAHEVFDVGQHLVGVLVRVYVVVVFGYFAFGANQEGLAAGDFD